MNSQEAIRYFHCGAQQQRAFFTRPGLLLLYIFKHKKWEELLREEQSRLLDMLILSVRFPSDGRGETFTE